MGNLWDKPGVPHKGWSCVDVIDIRGFGQDADETLYETCRMCGHENIRYVHVMEHRDFAGQLRVGCVCAEKMTGDYVGPKQRERKLKSKASRRAKWLTRKWRRSAKGNAFLNISGHNLGIFPNQFKPGWWKYRIGRDFSSESFPSEEGAKLALFEAFWTVLETKGASAED